LSPKTGDFSQQMGLHNAYLKGIAANPRSALLEVLPADNSLFSVG
jgi:hypothetical protein